MISDVDRSGSLSSGGGRGGDVLNSTPMHMRTPERRGPFAHAQPRCSSIKKVPSATGDAFYIDAAGGSNLISRLAHVNAARSASKRAVNPDSTLGGGRSSQRSELDSPWRTPLWRRTPRLHVSTTPAPSLFSAVRKQEDPLRARETRVLTDFINKILRVHLQVDDTTDRADLQQEARQLLLSCASGKDDTALPKNADAPTNEQASYTKFSDLRELNALRIKMRSVKEDLAPVLAAMEKSVRAGKITLMVDKMNVHSNIGVQVSVLGMLRGVHPLWLQLGMEAVVSQLHDCIALAAGTRASSVRKFAAMALLRPEPDLASKFLCNSVRSVPLSNDAMEENGRRFVIKFLSLVMLLDTAKMSKIITPDVCLFVRSAPFKSTKQLLEHMVVQLVSARGNLIKVLKAAGFVARHEQTPLDDRVLQVLTGDDSVMAKLVVRPDMDLTRKRANLNAVITAFAAHGVNFAQYNSHINADNIANGMIGVIVDTVWAILGQFVLGRVDARRVAKEITLLEAEQRRLASMGASMLGTPKADRLRARRHAVDSPRPNALLPVSPLQRARLHSVNVSLCGEPDFRLDEYATDAGHKLLARWIQLAAALAGFPLHKDDVQVSALHLASNPTAWLHWLRDGRAACGLLAYYAPGVLDKHQVAVRRDSAARRVVVEDKENALDVECSDEVAAQLKANEQSNWRMFLKGLRSIGAWSDSLSSDSSGECGDTLDMERRSDRNVLLLLLNELCGRLMDMSLHRAAAVTIQRAYRAMAFRRIIRHRVRALRAAVQIQRWWRGQLRRRQLQLQHAAATRIQHYWRHTGKWRVYFAQWKAVVDMHKAAACIQAQWRMVVLRYRYVQLRWATVRLQALARGMLLRRRLQAQRERMQLQRLEHAATRIQAWTRMVQAARRYKLELAASKQLKSVVIVQSLVRRWLTLRRVDHSVVRRAASIGTRLRLASDRWKPDCTIGARCANALKLVHTSNDLGLLHHGFSELATVARLTRFGTEQSACAIEPTLSWLVDSGHNRGYHDSAASQPALALVAHWAKHDVTAIQLVAMGDMWLRACVHMLRRNAQPSGSSALVHDAMQIMVAVSHLPAAKQQVRRWDGLPQTMLQIRKAAQHADKVHARRAKPNPPIRAADACKPVARYTLLVAALDDEQRVSSPIAPSFRHSAAAAATANGLTRVQLIDAIIKAYGMGA